MGVDFYAKEGFKMNDVELIVYEVDEIIEGMMRDFSGVEGETRDLVDDYLDQLEILVKNIEKLKNL